MIDAIEQRAIRELFLHVGIFNAPVYYVPYERRSPKQIITTATTLHRLPELPLPESNCILITEDPWSQTGAGDVDDSRREFWAFQITANLHDSAGRAMYTILAAKLTHPARPHFRRYVGCLVHLNSDEAEEVSAGHSADGRVVDTFVRNHPSARHTDPRRTRELAALCQLAVVPDLPEYWIVVNELGLRRILGVVSPSPTTANIYEEFAGPELTAAALMALGSIAAPCHYFIRSRFKGGIGNKWQRALTRQKPFISIIHYDRLYGVFKGRIDATVKPHFRRGHIRYLWKEAGLNRFALPDDPADRALLIQRHNVRGIYVHPAWVGPQAFTTGDVEHSIVRTEIKYNGLRLVNPADESDA